jgi:hypothetical protein
MKDGVIAVSLDHPLRFFVKHFFDRSPWADLVPHSWFGLQIEAEFISSDERRLGRSEGMKSNVIEPKRLANAD